MHDYVRVYIRWLIRRDLPKVLAIESASWGQPWTEDDFLGRLRQRNCTGMVAELGKTPLGTCERIIGFMVYELHRSSIDVTNFAVDPAYRRRGVGRQMIAKLENKLSAHRCTRFVIHAADANLGGHMFLKACGLKAVGIVPDFFSDGTDAYKFVYKVRDNVLSLEGTGRA